MLVKLSDVCVGKGIFVARTTMYQTMGAAKVKALAFIVERVRNYLVTELKMTKVPVIRIAPIKGKSLNGAYYVGRNVIEIDPRGRYLYPLLTTLAHEMVHASQEQESRLSKDELGRPLWMGTLQSSGWNGKGTGVAKYNSYRQLPWEAEAFARQQELMERATKALNIPNVHLLNVA